nr:hypothetical protein [Tanacetum cinerariifolium]
MWGKKANEPLGVTQVPVTEYVGKVGMIQRCNESGMNKFPSSYTNKLSPESLTKANLWKLEVNVPNGADYDVLLPLASVHEFNDRMKSSLYEYFIGKRIAFPIVEWFVCKNWETYRLEKVKFYDVPLVAYTLNGLRLMATKIGTLMILDSYTNSMCLEFWGRSSYARILIEINACNDFSDHLVMVVPNLKGNGYTKEIIRIKYEWEPPHCSTCLIFGHSPVDYLKFAPKRVVNQKDKDKINVLEKQILDGKLVLVDDEGKPLEKIDYPNNLGSDDELEPVEN